MLCHQGTDTLVMAKREIEAYKKFHHKNIIPLVDYLVDEHSKPGITLVYMVFPAYLKGNLFDLTLYNEENGVKLEEAFIIEVFKGVCSAIKYLHSYEEVDIGQGDAYSASDEQESLVNPVNPDVAGNAVVAYAHRDIKLANVMLAGDGQTPVLMDFGSIKKARFKVNSRLEALQAQDDAAENCTMAYRAPELFDVQNGSEFDERTDIWSLGCLLFALAFNFTPFEDPSNGPGASIALAAINANYSLPASNPYSDRLRQLVEFMLEPDHKKRPFIDQVIALANSLYQ
ncbi:Serine/threonine-protein kinase env7 [Dipsacomyces acuminosporus]|nr:Serine/threonine-protein kinase env7 [Dipsacomyces acuminosporus]